MTAKPTLQVESNSALADTAKPSRLSVWISKLPNYKLPLHGKLVNSIQAELAETSTTSERLADLIQQDPALCLTLFLRGQQQLQQRQGDIQSLVHLIGLLGQNQIATLTQQSATEAMPHEGLRDWYAASLFAAELAETLLPLKHGTRGSHFYLPSLLFNAPFWLMWIAAPKSMEQIQALASKEQQPLQSLYKKKLGFSVQSLLQQTQSFLPLPELSLKALAMDPRQNLVMWAKFNHLEERELKLCFERDKEAKKLFCSAESGIFLINQYVLALYFDWHGKHIKRWENLLSRHLGLSQAALNKHVVAIANEINMPKYLSGVFAPIYRYRGIHRQQALQGENLLQQYLTQLRETKDTSHCFQLTLEAMAEGVQAEHCLILPVENNHLQSPLSFGFSHKDINELDIDCDGCGPLFNALLQKPTAISINQQKLPGLEKSLPLALTRYWQAQPCGLMSLFKGSKPCAIILCDHKNWSEQQQQAFKAVGKQLTQVLK